MFSVVVPAYNVCQYVRRSLDSLLDQRHGYWEAILIDDGSTDGTAEILDEYAARDARFRVEHRDNAGVSAARNRGIELARGEYIVFLDADDALLPWTLSRLSEYVAEHKDADIITYASQKINSHVDAFPPEGMCSHNANVYRLDDERELSSAYYFVVGSLLAWNGCYRRSLLAEVKFKPFTNGEDMLFGSDAFCAASCVVTTGDVLYRYLVSRPNSAVKTMSMRHMNSVLGVAREWGRSMHSYDRYSEVSEIWLRKLRNYLLGVGARLVSSAKGEVGQFARSAFIGAFCEIVLEFPDTVRVFGVLRTKIIVKCRNWAVFTLLERCPFELRARLAKIRDRYFHF